MQNFQMLNTKKLAHRMLQKSQQSDRVPNPADMKIIFSPAEYLQYVSARRLGASILRIPLFTFFDNEQDKELSPRQKKLMRRANTPIKTKKDNKGGSDNGKEVEI